MVNTKWNYGWLVSTIFVVSCILYLPQLITTGRVDSIQNGKLVGTYTIFGDRSINWYQSIFCGMNMIVASLLPMLLVTVANSTIAHGLRSLHTFHIETCSSRKNVEGDRHISNIAILLLISTTSVVFTLPHPLYILLGRYKTDTKSVDLHGLITFRFILPLFDALNRSINIFLFCGFGKHSGSSWRAYCCVQGKRTDGGIPKYTMTG